MTLSAIAAQVGLSERMVRRYLVALGIEPTGISGRSVTYPEGTLQRVREEVLAARARRADAVRAAITRRHATPPTSPVISVRDAKRQARGGAR